MSKERYRATGKLSGGDGETVLTGEEMESIYHAYRQVKRWRDEYGERLRGCEIEVWRGTRKAYGYDLNGGGRSGKRNRG